MSAEDHSSTRQASTLADGIVVDGIGKTYKDRAVVKSVSLQLARGEVVGLLGPNGAGKTTCFYMITGLIEADYGTIRLDGQDITHQPMYQRARLGIGYLPQEASIFRGMSVEQNILAVLELNERSPAGSRKIARASLEDLRITHIRQSPATALSGGERRRVEIARALAASRRSCCSTSRSPVSIRWPSPISAKSSPISRAAASAS